MQSNTIRIRHTSGAKERLEQAHRIMGMSNRLTGELEGIFNQWAKVNISDEQVKRLIQLALVPNNETLENLLKGKEDELSSVYRNQYEDAFAYAMTSDTQQMETTKGTVFGAYNAITGYFQNVRSYKDQEAKVKSQLLGGTAQLRSQTAFNLCGQYAQFGADVLRMN